MLLANILCCSIGSTQQPIGQVFWASRKGEITELVLQTSLELVPGLIVQIGKKEFAVVGPKQRQDNTGFYYVASIPEVSLVKAGEPVYWVPIGDVQAPSGKKIPEVWLEIRKSIPFTPKKVGRVTAIQPPKVLIDKGSLHEVEKRDIFAVYDSSGRYKGQIEVRAIGDLQAIAYTQSGKLKRTVQKGDQIVYLGQRKLFNMGLIVAYTPNIYNDKFSDARHNIGNLGGGWTWSHTFPNGWGWEMTYGLYALYWGGIGRTEPIGPPVQTAFGLEAPSESRRVLFILPTWIRKNFFYPRFASPYIGAGVALMWADGVRSHVTSLEKSTVVLPAPVVGGGIEFWPGKFFHPRIEARYFIAPSLLGRPDRPLYVGFGFLTSW